MESKVCHKTEKSCNEVTSCYGDQQEYTHRWKKAVTKERDGGCRTYDQHKLLDFGNMFSQCKGDCKPLIIHTNGDVGLCQEKCKKHFGCDGFVALKDGSKCWLVGNGCGKEGGQKEKYDFYRKKWLTKCV